MIKLFSHHENQVWADEAAFGRHRRFCLCFRGCLNFKPGQPDNCPIAQKLYDFDVEHKLTTPVYGCPEWRGEQTEPQHVWEYLPQIFNLLEEHLKADEERWGDVWLQRTRRGQWRRTFNSWAKKWDVYFHGGKAPDGLSFMGDAAICVIRDLIAPHRWKE